MTTSGTTSFNPSLGEIVLYAYNRCGIRPTSILQEHMEAARMAANMVCADFSNRGVNLWRVDLVTTPLVSGAATYNVDPSTVVMLDAYIRTTVGGISTDRIMLPISRSEYASYSNKAQAGFPTVYWMDRLLAPTVTLWLVPDGTQTSLNYYALQQIEDAGYTGGQTVDVPYLWMKAFSDALSVELAVVWAPDRLAFLAPMADKSYEIAAEQNVENSNFYIGVGVSGYYRP